MGRKHSPKGQVVLRKDEKLKIVADALPSAATPEEFAGKFVQLYPDDWDNIVKRYRKHERSSGGKAHPMPEPSTYLLNMVKNYLQKRTAKAEG